MLSSCIVLYRMGGPVIILSADKLNSSVVLVTLSDGRVLELTLEQLLAAHPQDLPAGPEGEDEG